MIEVPLKKTEILIRGVFFENCNDEIENNISNINIKDLFDNKLWECTVVFIDEVAFSDTSKKCE